MRALSGRERKVLSVYARLRDGILGFSLIVVAALIAWFLMTAEEPDPYPWIFLVGALLVGPLLLYRAFRGR